ncbi:restriction endonuclease subunit R [Candidatus Epulonipiscium fishelsonii]|nr:restriction endonuclease subunit R [Epulopiscium sp. SCG-C06WGA-EpuloA1]
MRDDEKQFEQDIETYLLSAEGGYKKANKKGYDLDKAINISTLVKFIKASQSKDWERQVKRDGDEAEKRLYLCLQDNIEDVGLIHVLRYGIKDRGISFKICYFEPETTLNDTVMEKYKSNILEVTRQFRYSSQNRNTIDMVLSLNGIPIVAIELKNNLKGQNVNNAKTQWINDRNPADFIFKLNNRFLVYFAIDLFEAAMFTQLKGKSTYFLPFNQGSGGAGNVGGAGNPQNDDGYVTDYVWKKVLQKDSLISLIQRYIHFDICTETIKENGKRTKKISKKIIFPRYHQLDVVNKLTDDVRKNGSGKNYLIQHSAGSGKSNSIAWLAYRLSNLHDSNNEPVFSSVIVVTDRRVLDSQLQQTISGFDHTKGTVEVIDRTKNSSHLRDAINEGKKIIIATLQKFPRIYEELDNTTNKNFAIIVDEAHSSQTGRSAEKLKAGLINTEQILKEYAEIEQAEENDNDAEELLIREMLSHGKHDNLSFFAFTATPKEKTLEIFGEKQWDGSFKAFHTYSMKQAIEEGFILDVLKNYMTYKTCYKIAKNTPDNPEVPASKAVKTVKRFQELHPYNLNQKTAIMIEQFRDVTKNKIGGNAKAMVVTSSRLHAVRYYHEFKKYIEKNKYTDLDILIAFSGVVEDVNELKEKVSYTEPSLNRRKQDNSPISESQLPEEFKHDFNCLIVAEKYQTGFDEPLLHTMFIDKKLDGLKAVQTLSRLNRTCKGKNDTFILDFVNNAEDIKNAFEPFYEATVLEEGIDVNLIYKTQNALRAFNLYNETDINKLSTILYKKKQSKTDLGKMSSILHPIQQRFNELNDEDKQKFNMTIRSFNKWYEYITHIIRMFDKDLQKEFECTSYLANLLKNEAGTVTFNIEDTLELEFYKLEETFRGSISLAPQNSTVAHPKSLLAGTLTAEDELLDSIIQKINDKFGSNFTSSDKVIIETLYKRAVINNKKLKSYAKNNDAEVYQESIFPEMFKKIAQQCYIEQMESFSKLFENKVFYTVIMEEVAKESYKSLRKQLR